jgi:hypothetical protein
VWLSQDTVTKALRFEFLAEGEPTAAMAMVMRLIRQFVTDGLVDTTQVYAKGLSMGGMGTFELVRRMASSFAAAVPNFGGASPATATLLRKTAWWVFHGEQDPVVPLSYSADMVLAFIKIRVPTCSLPAARVWDTTVGTALLPSPSCASGYFRSGAKAKLTRQTAHVVRAAGGWRSRRAFLRRFGAGRAGARRHGRNLRRHSFFVIHTTTT